MGKHYNNDSTVCILPQKKVRKCEMAEKNKEIPKYPKVSASSLKKEGDNNYHSNVLYFPQKDKYVAMTYHFCQ
jgi:hypothetical protein